MKNPRASELTRLALAVEKAGKPVSGVLVRWTEIDGREVQEWEIKTGADERPVSKGVEW